MEATVGSLSFEKLRSIESKLEAQESALQRMGEANAKAHVAEMVALKELKKEMGSLVSTIQRGGGPASLADVKRVQDALSHLSALPAAHKSEMAALNELLALVRPLAASGGGTGGGASSASELRRISDAVEQLARKVDALSVSEPEEPPSHASACIKYSDLKFERDEDGRKSDSKLGTGSAGVVYRAELYGEVVRI